MTTNKKLRIFLSAFISVLLIGGIILCLNSTIWKVEKNFSNTTGWEKLEENWYNINADKTGWGKTIAISRTFGVEEIKQLLGRKYNGESLCLHFTTWDAAVMVFCDSGEGDRQVYSFGNSGRLLAGTQSGNAPHFVTIPELGNKRCRITVVLKPSFDTSISQINKFFNQRKVQVPDFYLAPSSNCYITFIRNSMISALPLFLIFGLSICGVIVFLVLLVSRKEKNFEFLLWGVLCFFIAVGQYAGTLNFVYLTGNSFLSSFLSNAYIALGPQVFVYYMNRRNLLYYSEKTGNFISWVANINVILAILLSFVPVLPFNVLRVYIDLCMLLTVIYISYVIIREIVSVKTGFSMMDISILVACLSAGVDVVIYLLPGKHVNPTFFSSLGCLVLCFFSGICIYMEYFDGTILSERSKQRKEVVYKDKISGHGNEAALWHQYKKNPADFYDKYLVLFSISNYYEIYTRQSFEEAETAIIRFGRELSNNFSGARIFRFNGARFYVFMSKEVGVDYEQKLEKIRHDINLSSENDMETEIKFNAERVYIDSSDKVQLEKLSRILMMSPLELC